MIEVRNTGDVPIYICDSGFLPQIAVYINGEYAKAALQNSLVLNSGERGRLTLTTAPMRTTLVEVRLGTTAAKFAIDFSDFFALESAVLFSQRGRLPGGKLLRLISQRRDMYRSAAWSTERMST